MQARYKAMATAGFRTSRQVDREIVSNLYTTVFRWIARR
jgi:hypothetical protein